MPGDDAGLLPRKLIETPSVTPTDKIFDLVKVKSDGTVKGMDRALETILDRYPYLVTDDADDDEPDPRPKARKPTTGTARKKPSQSGVNQAQLRERFPKLKRRRSV